LSTAISLSHSGGTADDAVSNIVIGNLCIHRPDRQCCWIIGIGTVGNCVG
jgi:hypothetical protein